MADSPRAADWDARAPEVLTNQIGAYDQMRNRCPVALDKDGHWSLFKHADVVAALKDHESFSNAVSVHVAVPNGMDPPEHTAYRDVVNQYYTPERMSEFEPTLREITANLIDSLPRGEDIEVMSTFAEPFAIAVQNAFMGWSDELAEPLMAWNKRNHQAVLSQDRERISAVAMEFDAHIREQIALRSSGEYDDVTAQLMQDTVNGERLAPDEIVAIIRNWTVGELGTMAASFGIIIEYLATHPEVWEILRAGPQHAVAVSDEILRIHPPLIANRRRATRDITVGGRDIAANDRVNVVWASANRDENVFGDPDEFRLDRPDGANVLYGVGIHYCPGAPLARLEFRVLLEELLARVTNIQLVADKPAERAIFPGSGWARLNVRFE